MRTIVPVLVIGAILGLLLISALQPWVVVNYRGTFSFTPLDIARSYIDRSATSPLDFQKGDFSSLVQNRASYGAFSSGPLLFLMGITIIGLCIPDTNQRSALLASGAALVIGAAAMCLYGIESVKTQIIDDGRSDGPLAQLNDGFVSSFIIPGMGTYLALAGGVIALIFRYVNGQLERVAGDETDITTHEVPKKQDNLVDFERPAAKPNNAKITTTSRPPTPPPTVASPPPSPSVNRIVYKSSGTAALLAFFGAIFGLPGIGHIYVGRVGRGLLILVSGFALYIFAFISFFGGIFGGALGRSVSVMQGGATLGIFLIVMYFGLLIWQIFDARSLAKKLNEQVQLTGREPW